LPGQIAQSSRPACAAEEDVDQRGCAPEQEQALAREHRLLQAGPEIATLEDQPRFSAAWLRGDCGTDDERVGILVHEPPSGLVDQDAVRKHVGRGDDSRHADAVHQIRDAAHRLP
jgi:hypothetical protein